MKTTLSDPLLGHLVDGRYEVVSRIARGGMATVYLALDRRLDREVALKVMHAHLADGTHGPDFIARFRREARAAARLTHPGLVGVFDQGVDGDISYLTMEYVDGENLRRRMTTAPALTVGEALRITESVLDALTAAHRTGLVHRDIKPENVLLDSENRIKVTDFGLARAVTEVTATTTGTVLGTVAYLGPELVSRGISDARTDVYAVGVMLFEMLTGRQPFVGETPIQVAFQHVNTDLPAPSSQVDWLPQELDELVCALAARDPEDRPADASGALDLLRRTRARLDDETLDRLAKAPAVRVPPPPPPGPAHLDGAHDTSADPGRLPGGSSRSPVSPSSPDAPSTPASATTSASGEEAPSAHSGEEMTVHLDLHPEGTTVALPIGAGLPSPADLAEAESREHHALRRRRRISAAILTLLTLGLLGGSLWWFLTAGPGAYTTVPHVVGISTEQAQRALSEDDLVPQVVEEFSAEPPGTVLSTEPVPGDQVSRRGTVILYASKGLDVRAVPDDLEGATLVEATTALEAAGLAVGSTKMRYHDDVAAGVVLAVAVEAGELLEVGTPVELTVSEGPAPVTVISVVGASQDVAKADLKKAGLTMKKAKGKFHATVPKGHVISQTPKAESAGHRGDTVTVVLSKGPEMIEVPTLVGLQFDAAEAKLKKLGFEVQRKNLIGGFFGTVRTQSVAAGEKAPLGSTIVLEVV